MISRLSVEEEHLCSNHTGKETQMERELAREASDDGKEKATPTREINGPGPTALCGSVLAAEQRREHFYI